MEKNVNEFYCLIQTDSGWDVGEFSGSGIYNKRTGKEFCRKKEKTRWKRFVETRRTVSSGIFEVGEAILIPLDNDRQERAVFYIIDAGQPDDSGDTLYLAGR